MKFALLNPNWTFEGSIYFGCTEPHLPLEFGYSKALLESAGHRVRVVDAHMDGLDDSAIESALHEFKPDFTVLTTAPSYLFWRCAPPELTVPLRLAERIRASAGTFVIVGPHASTTPVTVSKKLNADVVIAGECEEVLPALAWREEELGDSTRQAIYRGAPALPGKIHPHASNMMDLPALQWPKSTIEMHIHHHHRFDRPFSGPGAEMEASRGCPYHCTFCAKENFRDKYRRRPLSTILKELDQLVRQGVTYIYFIDEIFLPNRPLLEALRWRSRDCGLRIGIQTRIDLWTPEMLDLLAEAGCVSIEAGVESLTEEGRESLDKKCRLSTEELSDRLIYAKERIPFVQGNLILTESDHPATVACWRDAMRSAGVWSNDPVPLFPYPGSPDYTRRFGPIDDHAWERAHKYYLEQFETFSEIQNDRPVPLTQLESR